MLEGFFAFEGYHVMLVVIGFGVISAYWLPRFLRGWDPAASPILIIGSATAFWLLPLIPDAPSPLSQPVMWERLSELTVIVALFVTGLKIDRLLDARLWRPTVRLLVIAMPLTIAGMALAGVVIGGLTMAGAILLGAVLAPTDPVLAGDVQVGPPQEGGEQPVRFTLTAEAGLNDGLAFPFVYLAILVAAEGYFSSGLVMEWLGRDVLYRIAAGTAGGVFSGWLLAKVIFSVPRTNPLALSGRGVVAIAGILFAYGFTELAEGYGFIAAFVSGATLRQKEAEDIYHRRLHDFAEAIEHTLTAVLLFMLGAVLPELLRHLTFEGALLALGLIFIVRPVAAILAMPGTVRTDPERWFIAFYGIRGIGSIYYLAYANVNIAFINAEELWAIIGFTILLSSLVHGLTAGWAMERLAAAERKRAEQTPRP